MNNLPKKRKQRFPDHFYNNTTYIGAGLSVFILCCELFLFCIDFFSSAHSVYLGLITYVFLPPFLIVGLILIPWGAWVSRRRILKGAHGGTHKLIVIDLSLSTHQNAILIFMVGTAIVLIMTAIGCYKAYNYTESERFCGVTCHQVMNPEYTAYTQSPHAQVKCVECHIGSGVGWYVHYKMAGVKMLFMAIKGTYSRPTPAPVETLRPAKETCEECHWPGKAFNAIQLDKIYYPDDPSKTLPWNIKMLIRIGGGQNGESGIHAHMYYGDEIYYVPEDAKRQKISWIKAINKAGVARIYTTKGSPYKNTAPPQNKIRKMDCMDCHNRPTHRFEAPDVSINRALAEERISPSIPMIKAKAVEVLSKEYLSVDQALEKIRLGLTEYYAKKQAAYYGEHKDKVEEAIKAVSLIYRMNFFPEMKSRWDAYPDNIGHMISLGCFRCHDDEHKTKTGEGISRKCTSCHIITQQGSGTAVQKDSDGLPFQHPFDGDESWKTTNCSECHTGG
ncbi:MAG: NapC/NirT family cytochrome c [Candidatus Omnitrophica bacterium]|nr:NapC/NirT family cytochrome c [Candidatus Omnitrophota bacterium]